MKTLARFIRVTMSGYQAHKFSKLTNIYLAIAAAVTVGTPQLIQSFFDLYLTNNRFSTLYFF